MNKYKSLKLNEKNHEEQRKREIFENQQNKKYVKILKKKDKTDD